MSNENRQHQLLKALTVEIELLSTTKQTLLIVLALEAIKNDQLVHWMQEVQEQLKNGHVAVVERTTNAKTIELITAFFANEPK